MVASSAEAFMVLVVQGGGAQRGWKVCALQFCVQQPGAGLKCIQNLTRKQELRWARDPGIIMGRGAPACLPPNLCVQTFMMVCPKLLQVMQEGSLASVSQ